MRPRGPGPACRGLSNEELEATFWYPGPHDPAQAPADFAQRAWDKAKAVCQQCPVLRRCRADCMGEEYGVWGGTDPRERASYRRSLYRQAQKLDADERAQLADQMHGRRSRGQSPRGIARRTGYSEKLIRALLAEREAALRAREEAREPRLPGVLADEERERLARMAAQGESLRVMCAALNRGRDTVLEALRGLGVDAARPQWPAAEPPMSDAWVWMRDLARTAHYLGQSEDGQWMYMSLRGQNRSPTRKWFPRDLVDLRRTVSVQILERGKSNAA